ncbi:hypothetical protein I4U23_000129 [Adineta vaga]|nr:hypothetical protein I4U23_000129 [Adineta vaga]
MSLDQQEYSSENSEDELDNSNAQQFEHIMLSYQWDNQKLVEQIYDYLSKNQNIPIWMDKQGGMQDNVFLSMSKGVQNCYALICFLTPAYQNSANCKKELTYALEIGTPVIPCIIGSKEEGIKWKPTGWLGMGITNLIYLDFSQIDDKNFENKCKELIQRINSTISLQK